MKHLNISFMTIIFVWLITGQSYAAPKISQAALLDFQVNRDLTVVAVEEYSKVPSLEFFHYKDKIYSTQFDDFFKAIDEFAYTNSFLRFKRFEIKGMLNPLLLAVAVAPGGSDVSYQVKLIAERNGTITLLDPEPLILTIQDGIFLGHINNKYGNGMITWKFKRDAAHYAPHRYEIIIYKWDSKNMNFSIKEKFITKTKFKNGCSALKHYGLPCRNLRDDVIKVEEDIGTLGIEEELLRPKANDQPGIPNNPANTDRK